MSFEDILEKAGRDIEKYGWTFMFVDADQELGMESFSYTIGFEKTYKHPEIITFGLPAESAHGIISSAAAAIKEGEDLPLQVPVGNILSGEFKVLFKPFAQDHYDDYLRVAVETYRTKDFRTQVMLWPDKEGNYPTDSAYGIQVQRNALKVISASEDFDTPALNSRPHLH